MTFATYYDSNDTGLGGFANSAGTLIAFLDAILLNGYNSKTLTTLTASGTLCTATLNSHGFRDRQWVTISGASPSQYNGTWQIITGSTSANTFQFNVSSAPGGSASGTIACIVAPLGWAKAFSGTNLAAYQPPSGNRLLYRVDDTGTTTALVRGFGAMTDVNTGTDPFPTVAQLASGVVWSKSSGVARRSIAWGNGSVLYLYSDYTGTGAAGTLTMIGDLVSFKSGDAWASMVLGQSAAGTAEGSVANTGGNTVNSFAVIAGHYIARSYTQLSGAVTASKIGDPRFTASGASQPAQLGGAGFALAYPNPSDGNLWTSQVTVMEVAAVTPRGVMQGFYHPCHNQPLTPLTIQSGAGALAGKEILPIVLGTGGEILAEISNTW